jgi:uncharacterized protein YcbX
MPNMDSGFGEVAGLWRYPVSSLRGAAEPALGFAADGAAGDRRFVLVDTRTDAICRPDGLEAAWLPAVRIATRLGGDGALAVALPGGEWIAAPGAEADEVLSDYLRFPASIRPVPGAIPPGYCGPVTAARYVKAPVHLLTTASLAELKRLHPAGDPHPSRFRANVLVAMPPVEGRFPETEWIGRRIAIGNVELTVTDPCRRCGFTVVPQEGVERDPEILRNVVRWNSRSLGVYCSVDRPGTIGEGDAARFID